MLNRYAGDDMKIVPAADNNISARMQRRISKAIKQARYLSLLPYTRRHSINEENEGYSFGRCAQLGQTGRCKKVRPGFARNYLFQKGKAELASVAIQSAFKERRAELEKRQATQRETQQKICDTLNGYTLQIPARASPDGKLYGSITTSIIATMLSKIPDIGVIIRRGQIILSDGPLKTVGEHEAQVILRADLKARIKISVLAEVETGIENGGEITSDKDITKERNDKI